ncbi:MAG TPA: PDDEXK nuclease domain-containing protein [Chlamydiales bacterium]|nr:PDDEXK nuclease domain-containing protein [Chlamydiales bacterium]
MVNASIKDPRPVIAGYAELLDILKDKIRSSQLKAAIFVNVELIQLYWEIGREILQRQKNEGWGSKVIERLAKDLKDSFPEMAGFSPRNLFYMKQFAEAYPEFSILQQAAAKIPWGHNMLLIDKFDDLDKRLWYAQKTIENGWSRNVLEMWIESDLYGRQGKAITNFSITLPQPDSDLANATLKDPYCFDFLSMREKADEAEIEAGLIEHIQKVLVELGTGFAFVGRQYRVEVEEEEFVIDLLFYHFKLKRFIVVELKSGPFKPEYVGKMGFYLAAVDAQLKQPNDAPSIGMILCKTKKKLVVEYTLQENRRPIGVATYTTKLIETLPQDLKFSLPTIEQIEAKLTIPKKIQKQ